MGLCEPVRSLTPPAGTAFTPCVWLSKTFLKDREAPRESHQDIDAHVSGGVAAAWIGVWGGEIEALEAGAPSTT